MLKIFHVRTIPKSNLKVVGTEAKPIPLSGACIAHLGIITTSVNKT